MRTTKRYTNQTFTRHVDDEKVRHRTLRSLPEPSVCEACGDVYTNRRWSTPDVKRQTAKHESFRTANQVVCPACQRQRSGVPSGYVYVQGDFLAAHRDEITRLLLSEAERSLEDNPLARIMGWETDSQGRLTVTTTTEHLARRLGHSLGKSYHGKLRYGLSQRNKLARVWWQRD
jgi:hypothetical protein